MCVLKGILYDVLCCVVHLLSNTTITVNGGFDN